MKAELKFLAKVADKKAGYIRIKPDCVEASSGGVSMRVYCETGLDMAVSAGKAIAAANAIKGDIKTKPKDGGVIMSGGGVRVTVPTVSNDQFPELNFSEDKKDIGGEIVGQLQIAAKFAADGDVRPCFNGVHVGGGKIEASSGLVAVVLDGVDGIDAIIPKRTIDVMVGIGENPSHVASDMSSITFYYSWGAIRSSVIDARYPNIQSIIPDGGEFIDPAQLKGAISTCLPMIDDQKFGRIVIDGGKVSDDKSTISVDVEGDHGFCVFGATLINKALDYAKEVSFPDNRESHGGTGDQKPLVFRGDYGLIGVVAPSRL